MAKRKASRSFEGQRVRVKDGVKMPESDSVGIAAWTGTVVEAGAGETPQLIIEWDAASIANIPETYQAHCDAHGLFAGMACLTFTDVEFV